MLRQVGKNYSHFCSIYECRKNSFSFINLGVNLFNNLSKKIDNLKLNGKKIEVL